MKYSEWLVNKLKVKEMSQSDLAKAIGKSKSCVSDWVNGVSVPMRPTQQVIETVLGSSYAEDNRSLNLTVDECATLMQTSRRFVEEALKQGKVDWGMAVQVGERYYYHISAYKFNQYLNFMKGA